MQLARGYSERKVPQRMMQPAMITRVRRIVQEKDWSPDTLQRILFVQGYGRKSLNACTRTEEGR